MLEEQHLNPSLHNRADFDCGIPELNNYLARYATQDSRRNLSQVYVLVDTGKPDEVLGYYTLSAAHIDINQISGQEQHQLPHYPIPCFRMGRFVVRRKTQDQGIGKHLLGCAVNRCLRARREVAAYALIVDAKDAKVKSFYEHFGFNAFADTPFSLYLTLS